MYIDVTAKEVVAAAKKAAAKELIDRMSTLHQAHMLVAVSNVLDDIDDQVQMLAANAKLLTMVNLGVQTNTSGSSVAAKVPNKTDEATAAVQTVAVREKILKNIRVLQNYVARVKEEEFQHFETQRTAQLSEEAQQGLQDLIDDCRATRTAVESYAEELLHKYELPGAPTEDGAKDLDDVEAIADFVSTMWQNMINIVLFCLSICHK